MTNEELKTQIKELRIAGKQSFLYGDSMLKAADSIEELAQDLEREKEYSAFWEEQAKEAKGKLQKYMLALANALRK